MPLMPLMPQVAGGLVEPRHICVSLSRRQRHVRFVLGDVQHVDTVRKAVSWIGPEGASGQVIWCVGVRPDLLVDGLDLATNRGPLAVDGFMSVPDAPDIYACGDCAAVPDVTRPGQVCGMTAQHAQRQGKQVARNVAASLGTGKAKPYKHHDEGFLVDLGGLAAACNLLHVPVSGPAANALTRGYHLSVMSGNRLRILGDWALNGATPTELTSFGVISAESVPLGVDKPRP